MENDASHSSQHSALFYLLQEVSKLASPIHSSFLDTNPTSTWLNETPGQGPFMLRKQEEGAHSFKMSHGSFQHSLCHIMPYNPGGKEDHANLIEPHPQCNSPWKALSLINLQCEKLLHHGDVESNPSSVSSISTLSHLRDKSLSGTEQGGGFMHVDYYYRPSVLRCETEETPACEGPRKVVSTCTSRAAGSKTDCYLRNSNVGRCVQLQTAERRDAAKPELVGENGTASAQTHHGDQREDVLSVGKRFEWKLRYKEEEILKVPFENASPMPIVPQLTFNSGRDASIAPPKATFMLDHNANLALTTEALCEARPCPVRPVLPTSQSASLFYSTAETCSLLPNQGDDIASSEQEYKHGPIREKSPLAVQLRSSGYIGDTTPLPSTTSKTEFKPVQKEQTAAPPCPQLWRSKARRKQLHPSRSVDVGDPDFRGVTFRIDTELDDSREQYRLLITSKYSKELCKRARKPKMRTRLSQKSLKISSSDEESEPIGVSKGKVCASCCTSKTPMWRDAEDGTPLCNACGIRYKKYKVRCINCWHIPRKEGNSTSHCLRCGHFGKLPPALLKHTT